MYKVALRVIFKSGINLWASKTCETQEAAVTALGALMTAYQDADDEWLQDGFDDEVILFIVTEEVASVSGGVWS